MSLGGSLSTTSRTMSTGREPTGVVPSNETMLDERVDRGSWKKLFRLFLLDLASDCLTGRVVAVASH